MRLGYTNVKKYIYIYIGKESQSSIVSHLPLTLPRWDKGRGMTIYSFLQVTIFIPLAAIMEELFKWVDKYSMLEDNIRAAT